MCELTALVPVLWDNFLGFRASRLQGFRVLNYAFLTMKVGFDSIGWISGANVALVEMPSDLRFPSLVLCEHRRC